MSVQHHLAIWQLGKCQVSASISLQPMSAPGQQLSCDSPLTAQPRRIISRFPAIRIVEG